jgi:hypothetical protein
LLPVRSILLPRERKEAMDFGLIDLNRRVSLKEVARPGLILLPQTPQGNDLMEK